MFVETLRGMFDRDYVKNHLENRIGNDIGRHKSVWFQGIAHLFKNSRVTRCSGILWRPKIHRSGSGHILVLLVKNHGQASDKNVLFPPSFYSENIFRNVFSGAVYIHKIIGVDGIVQAKVQAACALRPVFVPVGVPAGLCWWNDLRYSGHIHLQFAVFINAWRYRLFRSSIFVPLSLSSITAILLYLLFLQYQKYQGCAGRSKYTRRLSNRPHKTKFFTTGWFWQADKQEYSQNNVDGDCVVDSDIWHQHQSGERCADKRAKSRDKQDFTCCFSQFSLVKITEQWVVWPKRRQGLSRKTSA